MRTPLHAINLHLEMVSRLSGGPKQQEQRDQVKSAQRVLDAYVRRTSFLLDAARIHAGAFKLRTEPVALQEVVETVIELFAAKAAFQQTSIAVQSKWGIVGQWDRAAVETILGNLLSNALKYGEGSPILIKAEGDDEGNAVISVIDSGPGIDEKQQSLIFEKYRRAVQANSTTPGYGLGLWVARQLARLHGGSIVLDAGRPGATFVVTLPLQHALPDRSTA